MRAARFDVVFLDEGLRITRGDRVSIGSIAGALLGRCCGTGLPAGAAAAGDGRRWTDLPFAAATGAAVSNHSLLQGELRIFSKGAV